MEYVLESLSADGDDLRDQNGDRLATINSEGSQMDDEAIAAEIAHRWNAFTGSGIPTAALTHGLVGEMVDAASGHLAAITTLRDWEAANPFNATKEFDRLLYAREAAEDRLRALLARIGKAGE